MAAQIVRLNHQLNLGAVCRFSIGAILVSINLNVWATYIIHAFLV